MNQYLLPLALIGFLETTNRNVVADVKRLTAQRVDGNIQYKIDDATGPIGDGAKEIDVSLKYTDDGTTVLFVQSQSVIDQLDMNAEEINQLGQLLNSIHAFGAHLATAGAAVDKYTKNVDILESADGKTWTRFDATNSVNVQGFQPIDNERIALRIGDTLGVMPSRNAILAIKEGFETVEFDGGTLTMPKRAELPPRLVNKSGQTAFGYKDGNKVVVAEQMGDKLVTGEYELADDVVGNALLPMAAINADGNVDGSYATLGVDTTSGQVSYTPGLGFGNVFKTTSQPATAK